MPEFKSNCRIATGITLFEVVLSMLVLSVVGVALTQAVVAIDRAHDNTRQFDEASRALENVLAGFASQPYEQLTSETAESLTLLDDVQSRLVGATLTVTLAEEDNPVAKRITAQLVFDGARRVKPISLTTWVFAPADSPGNDTTADDEESP